MTTERANVCIMVGHDDDVVLDPQLSGARPRGARSKWEGRQSDVAIAESMLAQFPQLRASYARTIEELLATDAPVVLVLSSDAGLVRPVRQVLCALQG